MPTLTLPAPHHAYKIGYSNGEWFYSETSAGERFSLLGFDQIQFADRLFQIDQTVRTSPVRFQTDEGGVGQGSPDLVSTPSGGYILTWTGFEPNGGSHAYFQVFDAESKPVSTMQRVFDSLPYSQSSHGSSIAVRSDGSFAIVGGSTDGQEFISGNGLFVRLFDARGVPLGSSVPVNTYLPWGQDDPSVAFVEGGGFVVTWTSSNQDYPGRWDYGIYGQRFNSDGTPIGPEFIVPSDGSGSESHSCVIETHEGFLVTWDNGVDIFARRFDTEGQAISEAFVVNTTTTNSRRLPSAATLVDGSIVIAWTSDDGQDGSSAGVFAQIFDSKGNKAGSEFQVNTTTEYSQWFPDVTAMEDGGFLIAWESAGQVRGGYAQRFTSDGIRVGREIELAVTQNQPAPIIDELGRGDFVAAWVELENGVQKVFSATFSRPAMNGTASSDQIDASESDALAVYAYGGDDVVRGSGGHDLLDGGAGNDHLQGGLGNDRLQGSAGADFMAGGAGDDVYVVDSVSDVIEEAALQGNDTVKSSVSGSLGANLENLTLTGTGSLNGIGNALANTITGNSAANRIDGGLGADLMVGGLGNDTYVVDRSSDSIIEAADAGIDTIESSITYKLSDNLERLVLSGSASITGTGNDLVNVLTGNDGNNLLNGELGADTMSGAAGDDTYFIDNERDKAIEALAQGSDTVRSSVSFTIGLNIEKLVLEGSALRGTGNALANVITGNAEANFLNGGVGADTLRGAAGNDTYYVDNAGDKALEASGAGVDVVRSTVSYTLGLNVEKLVLTGTALNGTGNSLANELFGNASANALNGGGGADTMSGGAGNDTYYVDNAGDRAVESANAGADVVRSAVSFTLGANLETLVLTGGIKGVGNNLANSLYGNTAANVLDGATGADTMNGGTGNDIYYVDNAGDKAVESLNAGTDKVSSSVDFTLGSNVEDLILTGTALKGTGNSLANTITGTSGANILSGGSGDDVLSAGLGNDELRGGLGNDDLRGGSASDIFHFETALSATLNVDDILDFSVASDSIGLDRSVFRGIGVDGTLAASAFHNGSAAHDADDRILYDKATGHIFYDADGTGAAAAVLFATVTLGLTLTSADFIAYA